MCVSLQPAHFSKTTLFAAETEVGGRLMHVLGYQNTVQNGVVSSHGSGQRRIGEVDRGSFSWSDLTHAPSVSLPPGNAMILPIPAVHGTMSRESVLDTRNCRYVLDDMADAVKVGAKTLGVTRGASGTSRRIEVFDHDVYTIVLASDARDIQDALRIVSERRRPVLNEAIFDAYARWYPEWTVALCCFDTRDAKRAAPMLWVYEPMHPQALFAPALDSHTGDVPDLKASVDVDHTVIVASHRLAWGDDVHYRDAVPAAVRPYLPSRVVGQQVLQPMQNGDFVFRVEDVRAGRFKLGRLPPPGAAS